ncbi:MAG: hypothetical protein ABI779_27915, partial [Acidobacteriota bacterium]
DGAVIDRVTSELQQFFEQHPHFLSTVAEALPHVRLDDTEGNVLIPDFILKPIVAMERDSRWEVRELKLPTARLLVGKGARQMLSHEVMKAVTQIRSAGTSVPFSRPIRTPSRGDRSRWPRLVCMPEIGEVPAILFRPCRSRRRFDGTVPQRID